MILHSNLSNTDLENSTLDNVKVSGDLSNINLRNASLKQLTVFGNNFCFILKALPERCSLKS